MATLSPISAAPSAGGFPIDLGDVGTFSFLAGNVQTATVSGTWGNAAFSASSAGADLFIDDLLVAQCFEFDACWQNATGTQTWSYTFTVADIATGILDDGAAVLSVVQTSSSRVRIGALAIIGTIDVPAPGTLALLALPVLGFVLVARRRRA